MNRTLVFFLFFLSFLHFSAQKKALTSKMVGYSKAEGDSIEIANYLFDQQNYELALSYYKAINENHPKDLAITYRTGICYLNKTNESLKALDYFKKISEGNKKAYDVKYYIGMTYFINLKYDEAKNYFNEYITSKKADKLLKEKTTRLIENCENGKKLMEKPADVKIKNMRSPINTDYQEYGPVITSDESIMMFTYQGPKSTGGKQNILHEPDPYGFYFEDVFVSEKKNGFWTEPKSVGKDINGVGHDACIALSSDGQKLFLYKHANEDNGDIYLSKLQGNDWSSPEKLNGEVNKPDSWEGSITLSADEKTIYFSSNRPGGEGRRDLYKATLSDNGIWGNITNLGLKINTKYDDDAPFIHPNGKQLYFSSKGHNSMGGYDIFRTDLQTDGTWSEPINLGYPINTSGDDRYYVATSDGKKAFYSSEKPDGLGKQDIYEIELKEPSKKSILVLVKGQITKNNVPISSSISVSDSETGKNVGEYSSNKSSGKYIVNLQAGKDYKIIYSIEGFEDQIKTIEAKNIEKFYEKRIDISFYNKAELYLVDANGKILQTGKQNGYGSFLFSKLPPSKDCLFKVIPEDDSLLIRNLKIYVDGNDKPLFVVKDISNKYLRLRELKSDKDILAKEEAENTTLLAKNFLGSDKEKVAETFQKKSSSQENLTPAAYNSKSSSTEAKEKSSKNKDKNNASKIPQTYDEYLIKYGETAISGVEFWVQIAAFLLPENFKSGELKKIGKIEKKKIIDDGLTRFVIGGSFKTLEAADKTKNMVKQKGVPDAFVFATYKGNKVSLKELIEKQLFLK